MHGPKPTEEDLNALVAFLGTLDFVPPPNRKPDGSLNKAARRGKAVFRAKACNRCHKGTTFTTRRTYKVGLESSGDKYQEFNPPSLRGVGNRAPYLHDGRAWTLEDVLTVHHRPSQLTRKPDLTPEELADLVEFLKSQ